MKADTFWTRFVALVLFAFGVAALFMMLILLQTVLLSPAHAATIQCAGIADMLAQLETKYGEQQLFVGHDNAGATVMIVANPAGSTWTALIIGENGNACIGAVGPGWSPGDPPGPQGTEG